MKIRDRDSLDGLMSVVFFITVIVLLTISPF